MTYKIFIAGLACAGLAAGIGEANAGQSPVGVWLDAKGRGAVEIKECGRNMLCGHIVWVRNQREQHGCGQQLIGNVRKIGAGSWDNGWIIDPDDRKKYDVALEPMSPTQLKVTGYMGSKLFSQDLYWTRAPANLERCDRIEEKKETIIAARNPEPVSLGPQMAPLPARNPFDNRYDIADITPPAPVPAVRVANLGGASDNLSEEAREAYSIMSASASDRPARPGDGFMGLNGPPQQFAYQQKTCRVVAPFVTLSFPCDR